MWERLVERVVLRVMPPGIADPAQHLIAAEAAENGIRYAWRVTAYGALAALLIALGVAGYTFYPSLRGISAVSDGAEAAGKLSASNAILRLGAANDALQEQLATTTRDRDALRTRTAELERQVTGLRTRLEAAVAAAARWERQAREYAAREMSRRMAAHGK